jgi:hypothetical protein
VSVARDFEAEPAPRARRHDPLFENRAAFPAWELRKEGKIVTGANCLARRCSIFYLAVARSNNINPLRYLPIGSLRAFCDLAG